MRAVGLDSAGRQLGNDGRDFLHIVTPGPLSYPRKRTVTANDGPELFVRSAILAALSSTPFLVEQLKIETNRSKSFSATGAVLDYIIRWCPWVNKVFTQRGIEDSIQRVGTKPTIM